MTPNIEPFQSRSAWTARDMADPNDWVHRVSDDDIAEIDAALRHVQARGLSIPDITRETFPLDGFAASLAEIRHEIEDGCGFVMLRGLPVDRYSRDEAQLIFWGIGAYWGEAVGQNQMGDVVGHVMNVARDWNTDNHGRGYQSRDALSFHCDKNDAVALMCWNGAKSGGLSCIASSAAIHNAMLERRPDLLELLYGPFHVDFRGEEMEGHKPYNIQPVFTRRDGRVYGRYGRTYIMTGQRFDDAPQLTDDQIAAVDMVDAMANSDEFRLDMTFERGDIQILNNHVILHSRTAFEDWPEPERQRHLFRLLFLSPTFADAPEHFQLVRNTSRYWRDHPRAPTGISPIPAD